MTGKSESGEALGTPAYCCPFCHERGDWYLMRHGDAVVSWSCDGHLSMVLDSLQRYTDRRGTEVSVKKVRRADQGGNLG